jgi:hypothetical protein
MRTVAAILYYELFTILVTAGGVALFLVGRKWRQRRGWTPGEFLLVVRLLIVTLGVFVIWQAIRCWYDPENWQSYDGIVLALCLVLLVFITTLYGFRRRPALRALCGEAERSAGPEEAEVSDESDEMQSNEKDSGGTETDEQPEAQELKKPKEPEE